jgi:fibronectin type 3 domain-containing protein
MKKCKLTAVVGIVILGGILVSLGLPFDLTVLGEGAAQYELSIMKPDLDTIREWIELYNTAPRAYIDPEIEARIARAPGQSLSLLNHLEYVPVDRNQGSCGNCWVWSGTGAMGIGLGVQEGVKDRLSVQYFTSCYEGGGGEGWACCGGWLDWFADWYEGNGSVIPWSNTNADWQDGGERCCEEHDLDGSCKTYGETSAPCENISTSCLYPISSTTVTSIETRGVGQETAIANIKNILNQDKAVWLAYFLPNEDDWGDFRDFWRNKQEDAIWNPDFSCEHEWDSDTGGGHAVLVVGYDDTDPENSYWIVLNSWGTTADRPNGLFRLDMDMNYDCSYLLDEQATQSFFWQTLDIDFDITSISRGLCWLTDHQNPNGSWSDGAGETAMALLGFLNAGYEEGDSLVDDAVQYVLSRRNGDGSFGSNETYETSLAILALSSTGNQDYHDEIEGAKDFLLDDCWDEGEGYDQEDWYYGGYGYGSDSRPDLSNTQFAAIALSVAGVPANHSIWDKIELFTTRCQNRPASNDQTFAHDVGRPSYNDGGFIYYPGYSIAGNLLSTGSMTSAGIWTLRFCGVPVGDARIQAALQWMLDNEDCSFDSNPNDGTGYLSYYIWSAAKALVMCFVDELDCGYWYPNLVDALNNSQSVDGSWTLSNLGTLRDTCFSILALQSAQPIRIIHWIKLILASHADLHIYDSQGRHLGMNYNTGQIENNIPGATFITDAQGRQIVELPELEAGHYRIELVGTSNGEYSLTVNGYRDQDLISSDTVNGTIGDGDTNVVDVVVSSLIGSLTIFVEDPEIVPSGLLTIPGDESVELSWYPYEVSGFNLAGYNVYRSTISGTGYAKINPELLTETAYHDTGLINGTAYYYVITAVDTLNNETDHSREVSAIPGIFGCWTQGTVQIQAQGSGRDSFVFGVSSDATDGNDIGIDIPKPPMPFAPFTYSYCNIGSERIGTNIMAPIECDESKSWNMNVTDEGGTNQVTLSWNSEELPSGGCSGDVPRVTLRDEVTGTMTDMRTTSTYTYTKQSNPETREFTITVNCSTCQEICTNLSLNGWHMVAVPGELCGVCGVDAAGFGDVCCAVCDDVDPCYIFRYESDTGAYVMVPSGVDCSAIDYQAGMGVWVWTNLDTTDICADVKLKTEKVYIPIQRGWSQIGNPFAFQVGVSEVTVKHQGNEVSLQQAQNNGWVSMYLFGYDTVAGGYGMLDPVNGQLNAWTGYWIRAYVDCEVAINPAPPPPPPPTQSALMKPSALGLDGIALPPAPPKISLMGQELVNDLTVCNIPNPIRSEHTTTFKVEGKAAQLVQGIRVEIYNQAGQKVFTQDINAKELEWHTDNDMGELLANGVYLYQVWVNIGGSWYPTGVHKLAVVR